MDVLTHNSQPLGATFVDVLCWRAMHHPDKMAYMFLLDGETQKEFYTYEEMIAATKVERGTHWEFLEHGGLYARLYNQQFAPQI